MLLIQCVPTPLLLLPRGWVGLRLHMHSAPWPRCMLSCLVDCTLRMSCACGLHLYSLLLCIHNRTTSGCRLLLLLLLLLPLLLLPLLCS
jgi:hypothetical protein